MDWHKSFTAALVTENEEELLMLLDSIPTFEEIDEMKRAMELIKSAMEIFEKRKSKLSLQMQEIKNQKKYITSTSNSTTLNLDIHS